MALVGIKYGTFMSTGREHQRTAERNRTNLTNTQAQTEFLEKGFLLQKVNSMINFKVYYKDNNHPVDYQLDLSFRFYHNKLNI